MMQTWEFRQLATKHNITAACNKTGEFFRWHCQARHDVIHTFGRIFTFKHFRMLKILLTSECKDSEGIASKSLYVLALVRSEYIAMQCMQQLFKPIEHKAALCQRTKA